MTLVRVAVDVPLGEAEEGRALALELSPLGFEEVESGDVLTLALYVDERCVERIAAVFPDPRVVPVAAGWEDEWRAFHRPARAGGLWIGPAWEQPGPSEPAVVIDPGRAFGTGAHATTRLCLELLLDVPRGDLLDAGCGSGVLAIAASKLGFEPVYAVDLDPQAIEATERNALANGVNVAARLADATVDPVPPTATAVVNVALDLDSTIAERLVCQRIITSGYLAAESPELPGYRRTERREAEGWAADLHLRTQ